MWYVVGKNVAFRAVDLSFYQIIFCCYSSIVAWLTPTKHQEMFVFDGSERQWELNLEEQIETCRESEY